jgi:thiamine pyrophosphokinase
MQALVVTGGDCPSYEVIRRLSERADLIIAADSGLEACLSAGIEPDFVVGDFDSVQQKSLAQIPKDKILHFPEDKEYTDTELAIELAHNHGAYDIALAGGGAGRLDHLLAVRALFERKNPIQEWHTAQESAFFLPSGHGLRFSAVASLVVSVFPLSKGAKGMHSTGLKWPLDGLKWNSGHFGVSNKSVAPEVEIDAGQEPVIVILPLGTEVNLFGNG